MQAGDLSTIKSLLLMALQQPESERESFVETRSDFTDEQKRETLALIRAQHSKPGFLDIPLKSLMPVRTPSLEQTLLSEGDILAGRYRIESPLSQTLNSQVFLAADLRMAENLVAIKIVPITKHRFQEIQDQLWREVESLARLHHPAISGLIDTGLHDGQPFLVTQYYPGATLDQWVKSAHPSRQVRTQVFLRLLSYVNVIHSAGLLHLDLKPQNIIVASGSDAQPTITILDFGISALASAETTHRAGTPHFSAPERSAGLATTASDVYSLGCIGAELLPDAPANIHRILSAAKHENPVRRPKSTSEFRKLLEAAMTRQVRYVFALAGLAATCLIAVAIALILETKGPAVLSAASLREVTSMRGVESNPAFSPDGETVYFSHQNRPSGRQAIWKTAFSGGDPVLLFSPPGPSDFNEAAPTPDGKYLFFIDEMPDETTRLIRGDLRDGSYEPVYTSGFRSLEIGPVPNVLYFTERVPDFPRGRLVRFDYSTKDREFLPAPPSSFHQDLDISISPNGEYAAFVRYRTMECADLFVMPLDASGRSAGPAVRITSLDRRMQSPHWFSDNRTIFFAAGTLTAFAPYRAVLKPNPLQLASVEALTELGLQMRSPVISPKGDRIVMVKDRDDSEIYSLDLQRPERLEPMISSTALDEEPRYSPDGRYISFFSERSGNLQGWIAERRDPTRPQRVTNFEMAEKSFAAWSPAGAAIFFARLPKLGPEFVTVDPPFETRNLRRMFAADHAQRVAGIAAEADSILIEANQNGDARLERWSVATDRREVIGHAQARFAREFFKHGNSGEKIILFGMPKESMGLFAIEDGKIRKIYPSLAKRNTFTYQNGFAYLCSMYPEAAIYKVNVRTRESTMLTRLQGQPGWGIDISPDGKELVVAMLDLNDSNLVAVERPKAGN